MRANMIIEKGATDRRLVHIFIDYKSNRLVLQTGRLFLCLIIILAECVSGTKAGNAEAHNCNKVHNTHCPWKGRTVETGLGRRLSG